MSMLYDSRDLLITWHDIYMYAYCNIYVYVSLSIRNTDIVYNMNYLSAMCFHLSLLYIENLMELFWTFHLLFFFFCFFIDTKRRDAYTSSLKQGHHHSTTIYDISPKATTMGEDRHTHRHTIHMAPATTRIGTMPTSQWLRSLHTHTHTSAHTD